MFLLLYFNDLYSERGTEKKNNIFIRLERIYLPGQRQVGRKVGASPMFAISSAELGSVQFRWVVNLSIELSLIHPEAQLG